MINSENDRKLRKLLLSLNHRLSPSVYFVSCNTEKLRKKLYETIIKDSPRFKHLLIDLTPHSVYSLRDAINRFVPDEVRNSPGLTYVVHFTGISSSLFTSEGGEFKKSMLLEELNFEREVIFQDYPFISFLWMNPFFYKEMFWKAGDLMSWAFDRYEFTDESPEGVTHEIPHKEPLQKQGAIPKRTERIKELEDLLDRLDEEDENQQKIMLEKRNALLLLGREYMTAFKWKEAENNLLQAKYVTHRIAPSSYQEFEVLFYLGDLYRSIRKFDEAISFYLDALSISKSISEGNVGNIYHQIGYAYAEQRRWEEALINYNKAIEWKEKVGNEYGLGSTYHEIGRIYAKQRLWEKTLNNYYNAIEWFEKIDNKYELGDTYHQIGIAYAEQSRWEKALSNYNKAIEWKEKTGNEYGLGSTFHQVGMAYAEQNNLEDALINYNKAIEWNKITGNEYILGSTYHQIGMAYAAQGRCEEALTNYNKAIELKQKTGNEYELGNTYYLAGTIYEAQGLQSTAKEYFEKAIENFKKFSHPFLPNAEEYLQRINQKLTSQNL